MNLLSAISIFNKITTLHGFLKCCNILVKYKKLKTSIQSLSTDKTFTNFGGHFPKSSVERKHSTWTVDFYGSKPFVVSIRTKFSLLYSVPWKYQYDSYSSLLNLTWWISSSSWEKENIGDVIFNIRYSKAPNYLM